MTPDRRPSDLFDALSNGLVIYYTFPLLAALIGGLGMVVGLILAIPACLVLWVSPEQFMTQHTWVFIVHWGFGIMIVLRVLFGSRDRWLPSGWVKSIGLALMFAFGSLLFVLLIATGLAFSRHLTSQ